MKISNFYMYPIPFPIRRGELVNPLPLHLLGSFPLSGGWVLH